MGNMAQKYPPRSPCVHYVAVNYDTVIIYKTVHIHQIHSRNLHYFCHKLKLTNFSSKLRTLIDKIPLYSYSTMYSFPFQIVEKDHIFRSNISILI